MRRPRIVNDMTWYAVDGIDGAIEETRSFLPPVSLRRWTKLAVVAVFVGAGGGSTAGLLNLGSSISTNGGLGDDASPADGVAGNGGPGLAATGDRLSADLVGTVVSDPVVAFGSVAVLLGIVLGLRLVSDVLRFAFYEALRTDRIALVAPARRRFGQALRLFGFTLARQAVTVLPFVAVGVAVVSGVVVPTGPAVLVGVVFAAGVVLASALVGRVTHEFVVPTMVITDSGVLDGWRRVWPVIRGDLPQFGVYLGVHFLILLVVGTLRSVLAGIVYATVLIAGGLVGAGVVFGVFGSVSAAMASPVGLAVLGLLVALALLVGWGLLLPVRIVVLSYVVTYEVSVLAAADDDLRLRPRYGEPPGDATAAG